MDKTPRTGDATGIQKTRSGKRLRATRRAIVLCAGGVKGGRAKSVLSLDRAGYTSCRQALRAVTPARQMAYRSSRGRAPRERRHDRTHGALTPATRLFLFYWFNRVSLIYFSTGLCGSPGRSAGHGRSAGRTHTYTHASTTANLRAHAHANRRFPSVTPLPRPSLTRESPPPHLDRRRRHRRDRHRRRDTTRAAYDSRRDINRIYTQYYYNIFYTVHNIIIISIISIIIIVIVLVLSVICVTYVTAKRNDVVLGTRETVCVLYGFFFPGICPTRAYRTNGRTTTYRTHR